MIKIFLPLLFISLSLNADWHFKNKFGRNVDAVKDNTLKFLKDEDGIGEWDYRYKFGAHISVDGAYFNTAYTYYEPDGSYFDWEFRRARIYYKGSFFDEKFFHEFEYSFTGANQFKDVFIGYKGKVKPLGFKYRAKLGNIKIPFGLEGYTSSKYNTFMERALTDSFSENRKLGAELLLYTNFEKEHYINLFMGVYGDSLDDEIEDKNKDDIQRYALRSTYGYKFEKNHLLSVGFSFLHSDMNKKNVRYKSGPESNLVKKKFLSVKVKDVDTVDNLDLEALYIYKDISFQGEYATSSIDSKDGKYNFEAYYLQGSYFITNHKRKYKFSTATLTRIKPKAGAIEVALRYSSLNLNDKDETGGEQTDMNYAINYYVNKEMRIMVNYITSWVDSEDYDGMYQVLQARLQIAF